ncbi:MAG: sulfite exporter TauE/SafE family protein [Candidatus Bathyarchaeia archaeon]
MIKQTHRIARGGPKITQRQVSTAKAFAALFFSFLMGIAAGLIGVGGGEFRIPILLYVIGLPVIAAVAVNLFVGLLTVIVSFIIRFQLGLLDAQAINVALIMSFASIIGSYLGAALTGRVKEGFLKKVLAAFLVIIGLKIGLEPFIHTPPLFEFTLGFTEETFLAVLVGVVIGVISGMFGVAGGEFRIPALIYVFGFDVKVAGTASLLVSIPTVATGFIKHRMMGHANRNATIIAIIMSIGSIIGAFVGASQAAVVEKDLLKVLLGAILILATVRMVTKP